MTSNQPPERVPTSASKYVLQDRIFLLLVAVVTLAFIWILLPFYSAIFWATVLAILFLPGHRRLLRRMRDRRALAALCTVLLIIVIAIVPAMTVAGLLVQEGLGVYQRMQSGELNFGRYLQQMLEVLPASVLRMLERFGLTTVSGVERSLTAPLMRVLQSLPSQAMNVGQYTVDLVVGFFLTLYLIFFLLRDGRELMARVRVSIPLDQQLQRTLASKFAAVILATMKGTVVVALVQGALGGLIFWILDIRAAVFWAVLMAFLSLLPALGTALVWLPVALYFLVTGAITQGVILIAYGVLVIGLVDNVLRPVLVGKDTKLPDYVVLFSTIGGMAVFGFNGFVIGPVIAALFIAVWDVMAQTSAATPAR